MQDVRVQVIAISVKSCFRTEVVALSAALYIIPLLIIKQSDFWNHLCCDKEGSGC